MDSNAVNGAQSKVFQTAILAAFKPPELDQLLTYGDRGSLDTLVASGPFAQQVFDLIELSKRDGWTEWLLTAVLNDKPHNDKVKTLVEDLGVADSTSDHRLRRFLTAKAARRIVVPALVLLALAPIGLPAALNYWRSSLSPIAQVAYYKLPDKIGLAVINDWRAERLLKQTFQIDDFCITGHEWVNLSGDDRYMDLFIYYYYVSDSEDSTDPCQIPSFHSKVATFHQDEWNFTYNGGAGEEANGENYEVIGRFVLITFAAGGEEFLNVKGFINGDLWQLAVFNAHESGYRTAQAGDDLLVALDQGFFRVRAGKVGAEPVRAAELAPNDDMSVVVSLARTEDTDLYTLTINGREEALTTREISGEYYLRGSVYVKTASRIYVDADCDGSGFKLSDDFFGAWIIEGATPAEGRKLVCWISHGEHLEKTPTVEISFSYQS